jgi:Na+/melibiose symporter-like transporter
MGVNLPSVVAAGLVERETQKRPYLLRRALWQRIPWGVVAIAIPLLATTRPGMLIVVILLAVLVATAAGGFVVPAFFHIVSVTVPVERRGTLFALRSVLSYLFGIGGGVFVQVILSRLAFPGNYSLLYGVATVVLFAGLVVFATIREPAGKAVERPLSIGKRVRRVLGSSRSYRAYLIARGFLILAFATTPFFPIYIVERFELPDSVSGLFAIITAATFILVNPVFGRLGNRVGYRPVFLIAFVSLAAAGIVGLTGPGQYLAYSLVAFTAVGQSVNLLAWNMTVEFAPEGEVPSYVGVTGLFVGLIGPLSIVTGLLVDWVGFAGVFVMALAAGVIGFFVMLLGVEEPRVMQRRINQPDVPI